jgi:transcriptional regulator with XRE-family HTH domain
MLHRMSDNVKTVKEVFGERLKALREKAGLSQQEVAARVAEHGGTMHQTTIMRTEKGTRNVTLNEYVLLAAALNVPPPMLLVPLGSEDRVEITPRSRIHAHLALDWLTGDEGLTNSERFVIDRGDWLRNAEPMLLWRGLSDLQQAQGSAAAHVKGAEYRGDQEQIRQARQAYALALEALHAHLLRMQTAGERPPGMAPETIAAMEKVGLDVAGLPVFEEEGA